MSDGMEVRTDLFFLRARMTPNRQLVADRCNSDEEGLGPRALSCLYQLADGQELRPHDAEWFTDPREAEPLALMVDDRPQLTELGWQLARLADAGNYRAIYALTTMPELNN
jgi:hypothetical protein